MLFPIRDVYTLNMRHLGDQTCETRLANYVSIVATWSRSNILYRYSTPRKSTKDPLCKHSLVSFVLLHDQIVLSTETMPLGPTSADDDGQYQQREAPVAFTVLHCLLAQSRQTDLKPTITPFLSFVCINNACIVHFYITINYSPTLSAELNHRTHHLP